VSAPTPDQQSNPEPESPAPCPRCRRLVAAKTDLALELAAAREVLAVIDSDMGEMIAAERHRFYRIIGGTELTVAGFKARVRYEIATGERV
jgi:hypothetical protein